MEGGVRGVRRLKVLEVAEGPLRGEELVLSALLDDAALVENEDAIGEAHAMRKSKSN